MTSNAYIASDGETMMKVGKANDPKRREKQIALPMTVTVACLDEVAAYRVERQLRQFVIEQGGIQHQRTIDWFEFDRQIYAMLCEFAGKLDGFEVIPVQEKDLDEEIAELRGKYFRLLVDELRQSLAEADITIIKLQNQLADLRELHHAEIISAIGETVAHRDQLIETLVQEAARWKTRYEILREQIDKNASK